jgi:acetyl-CoA acetyltransferase
MHDAPAMDEIVQGGAAAERGDFAIGRVPSNPSGGPESKWHPLGATGIDQRYELVAQLRGEAGARRVYGARHAIQESGGRLPGIEGAVLVVHILSKD